MSKQECEGVTDLMRKMARSTPFVTYRHVQINCTAPLETSGAIVRYCIKCWEPSSRSTTYSLTNKTQWITRCFGVYAEKKNNTDWKKLTLPPTGNLNHLTTHEARRLKYLWSSVSGSTKMFSCLSFTRRNTKESKKGSGTENAVEYIGFGVRVNENIMTNVTISYSI